ncbi:orotate phosphoribosyltransferase [Flavilitoribacter nigricans]|uniref:Orotate phosphoribosyltransferase n=1 Tax=Flavilitoribacter nigricans (strain ATCC 23147 / DSM 23189 / NBRC 102662 / NCIMB 1420 / SS-2) TaxID=1122177 RepID=A0A2D0NBU6_FLAN2|nr:orotate phosphoribosyltransferase [Flavilitoribacter nigricans]PHN05243.1 orotate phosphoribosyltransferase [Flavilitoribacter nigricans DSM 23189 = NBRC 102662]
MSTAAEVAKRLMQINAIKLNPQNPFTWASGLRSPIYCDNRLALSHPDLRSFLIDCFVEKAADFGPVDGVAGVATAGIPHGALLADRLGLPFIYVRSKAKGHGRQNMIEGEMASGARLLVIEDLISTGGSCLAAVEALREAKYQVSGVLAIFTYGFPQAQSAFEAASCPFGTLSSYPVLLEEAKNQKYITNDQLKTLQEWQQDPKAWSIRFSN